MQKQSARAIALLTLGSFFAFFVFGFTDNMKGATIPALLRDLDFNYSQGASVLLGAYVGFLIATLLSGMLADAIGKKAVMLVAGGCLVVGVSGFSSFGSFWPLAGSMFMIGLGLGGLEVGANTIIVDLHSEGRGRYLNILSVFHGLGSTLAPLYAGLLLAAHYSWRTVYRWDLALVALMLVYFFLVKYPRNDTGEAVLKLDFRSLMRTAFTGQMAWFYTLIALYVAAEIGIASWIVEFLQSVRGQPVTISTRYLALFFGMIMVGRFLGSFLVERVGYMRMMLLASLAAIACVFIGTFGPASLTFFLPLTGLFFSIIFPTITAEVSVLHRENLGSILGLLFTFAGVGGIFGPWLVGLFSDFVGMQLGFGVVLGYCVLMALVLVVLMRGKFSRPAVIKAG